MSRFLKWLQFFADGASGGDGGDGAGTGVNSADAGQNAGVEADDAGQRLVELGVPRDKAAKYAKRMPKRQFQRTQNADPPAAQDAPTDKRAETPDKGTEAASSDWDTFFQIPENKQRLESMMAERGKSATAERSAAQQQMDKLSSALELLSARYGKKTDDIDGLVEAITGDDLFFEDKALETGESVEKVKSEWQKEREAAKRQQEEREAALQQRFRDMLRQADDVKKEYPGFDFNSEIQNPDFVHMTAAKEAGGLGWDVRKAYRAAHQDEIEQQTVQALASKARADAQKVAQTNQSRPRENGGAAPTAVTGGSYSSARALFAKMTPEERLAYVKSLRRR